MDVAFFKVRCFICWKGFEVPRLPDSAYGQYIFINKDNSEFRFHDWFENGEIQSIIGTMLDENKELQMANVDTKGDIAIQLVGVIADGDFSLSGRYDKCPRCSCRFHSPANDKVNIRQINKLTFNMISNMDQDEKTKYLRTKLKTYHNKI